MKEYTIIVNTKEYGWCLHCLIFGNDRENALRVLKEERIKHPELELELNEYTKEESKKCWWNEYGTKQSYD